MSYANKEVYYYYYYYKILCATMSLEKKGFYFKIQPFNKNTQITYT